MTLRMIGWWVMFIGALSLCCYAFSQMFVWVGLTLVLVGLFLQEVFPGRKVTSITPVPYPTPVAPPQSEDARYIKELESFLKDWVRTQGLIYEALLADKESQKWIAPSIWQDMTAGRDLSRRTLALFLNRERE